MKQSRQELVASGHFARLRAFNEEFIAGMLEREAAGSLVNRQYAYKESLRRHLSNGCIALLLGDPDEEARKNFQATVEYALKLIAATTPPGGGVRIYQANVELSEQGSRLTSLHERTPQPGEEKLSITDYYRALICGACFGDRSQFAAVASVPEDAYQNPGTVASADLWAYVRASKALLLGDQGAALREAAVALSKGHGTAKAEAAAMIALIEGQLDSFKKDLQEAVKLFSRDAKKQPNDPIGVVFLPGLMLCRMAIDRGIPVEDAPYLPVRLLPHRAAAA